MKPIFLLFGSLFYLNPPVYAETLYLNCIDTLPFNGAYRELAIVFDPQLKFLEIDGLSVSALTFDSNTIYFEAHGYSHVINRVNGSMIVHSTSNSSAPELVFKCKKASKAF